MEDIFLARQPIYDVELKVKFYEILFRSGQQGNVSGVTTDGDQATSQVLINLFAEMGEENVTDNCPAFINLTRNLLLNDIASSFPKEKVVIEVLENMEIDEELITHIRNLKEAGYVIALDDFEYDESWRPIMELADYIKIDVFEISKPALEETLAQAKKFSCKLLAEKIETHEMFETCKELGFEYFQGYFLCKPKIMKGQQLPASKVVLLDLLAKLRDTSSTPEQLGALLGQDAALSVKLLRILNSASYALPRKVESLKEAVVFLGREKICNIANMLLMTKVSDKPSELMIIAMTRAKHAEIIGSHYNLPKDSCFTLGLFSTLDAMLDQPMSDVLQKIPLADDLTSALLDSSGRLGQVLNDVTHYEKGEWDLLSLSDLTIDDYQHSYMEALSWTKETCRAVT